MKALFGALCRRFRAAAPAPALAPSPQAVIERMQQDAVLRAGLTERMKDPQFPLSGLYRPEGPVLAWMLTMLALWDHDVADPDLIERTPHSPTQERITFPFVSKAWSMLSSEGRVERRVKLGETLFVCTAPTWSMRAAVHSELVSGRHVVVFDAGLFVNLTRLGCTISDLLIDHDPKNSRLNWGRHDLDVDIRQLATRGPAIDALADQCVELLVRGHLFDLPLAGADPLRDRFVPLFIRDSFLFLVAHEYAHIHFGHHDPRAGVLPARQEDQADRHAFADVCSTIGGRGEYTIGVFYNVMLLLFCFELIHRTVHFAMTGKDYGHLDGALQYQIMMGNEARHPGPAARRWRIAQLAQEAAAQLPPDFAAQVDCLEATLQNIWKLTLVKMAPRLASARISGEWAEQVRRHAQAYESFATS